MPRPLTKHNQRERDKALARAKQVAKMRNAGKSFAEIADYFKFSYQRAQQLYAVATATKNVE